MTATATAQDLEHNAGAHALFARCAAIDVRRRRRAGVGLLFAEASIDPGFQALYIKLRKLARGRSDSEADWLAQRRTVVASLWAARESTKDIARLVGVDESVIRRDKAVLERLYESLNRQPLVAVDGSSWARHRGDTHPSGDLVA